MSRLASPADQKSSGVLLLEGVDWRTYNQFLRAFSEQPGFRLTYDRGRLEIMPPLYAHDSDGRLLYDSTTLRRKLRQRGIEADECFWIKNAARMAGRRRLDLRRDPAPDLAIEVDVTSSSLDRLEIYAALGVPEVWRLEGNKLTFFVLEDGERYIASERSRTFSFVTSAELVRFLRKARRSPNKIAVLRDFRVWVRQQIKT